MKKTIYNYHPQTGELLSISDADMSPLEPGVFLVPQFATDVPPPKTGDNQVCIFENNGWSVKADWRGHHYWLPDGTEHDISEIGITPPIDACNSEPPPSLEVVKQTQSAAVKAACAAAITGGFKSSALGKSYTYPSTQNDQSNLAANVLSSMYPNLPANWTTLQLCCDAKGVWAYLPHTAAQIQQVGTEGNAAILNCLTKNAQLQNQILAAQDVLAVLSINW